MCHGSIDIPHYWYDGYLNAYSAYFFVRKCFTSSQLLLLVLFITPSMHFFGQKVRITIAQEMEMEMMMSTCLFFGA
jgi:hypothetical protein